MSQTLGILVLKPSTEKPSSSSSTAASMEVDTDKAVSEKDSEINNVEDDTSKTNADKDKESGRGDKGKVKLSKGGSLWSNLVTEWESSKSDSRVLADEKIWDCIVKIMVKSNKWEAVGKALSPEVSKFLGEGVTVSPEVKAGAIKKACEIARDMDLRRFILEHCTNEITNAVIRKLVARNFWASVARLMKRGISEDNRVWIIQQARKETMKPLDWKLILPYFTTKELKEDFAQIVSKQQWKYVNEVLKEGVDETCWGTTCYHLHETTGRRN